MVKDPKDLGDWELYIKGIKPLKDRPKKKISQYKRPHKIHDPNRQVLSKREDSCGAHRGRSLGPQKQIDLHGYTERTVFDALEQFIVASIQADVRCVLVITGKGTWQNVGDFILKDEIPRFLESSAIKKYIVSFRKAPYNKGGEGALILDLKAKKKVLF